MTLLKRLLSILLRNDKRINPQIILLSFLTAIPIAATAAEETLGRLFYTPEERASLDRARQGIPDGPNGKTADTPIREQKLNGYVKRSDGHSTLWVDGTPRYVPKADAVLDPSTIKTPNNITVHPSKKLTSGK